MNTPDTAVVYYPAPEKQLTPEELRATIGRALDGSPQLATAMRQMLAERLARRTLDVAHLRATPEDRSHLSGRLAEILSIQHELFEAVRSVRELNRLKTGRKA